MIYRGCRWQLEDRVRCVNLLQVRLQQSTGYHTSKHCSGLLRVDAGRRRCLSNGPRMMVVVVFDMFGEKESRRKLGMVRGWTFTTMTTGMLSTTLSQLACCFNAECN